MLTCSRPMIERTLRPPHDQGLKCPRCDSTHIKFCYYNNYSLSQPRYFCKTCRRYWTKGGTLRNIPAGGGCRKNKKVSYQKSNDQLTNNQNQLPQPSETNSYHHHHNPKDLHLSYPDLQFSHCNMLGTNAARTLVSPNLLGSRYNDNIRMFDSPIRPLDFMESKMEGIIGSSSSRNFDIFGNSDHMGMVVGLGGDHNMNAQNGLSLPQNFHSLRSPTAFSAMSLGNGGGINNNNEGYIMDYSCHRLMLPYDHASNEDHNASIDVKPNPKLLSHECQDQGCSDAGKESFGYLNGPGSWTGYGSSTTNPLV